MERERVIRDLAASIAAVQRPHPTRVAIDGVDAAGKTRLADELAPVIAAAGRPVIRASVDGFHNPRATRYQRGRDSADGYFEDSFDHTALIEGLLRPLGPGGSLQFRRIAFDFRTDQRVEAPLEIAAPNGVLLLDGVFLLRPELRPHFDFSVFLRVGFDVSLARAETRDLALFGTVDSVRDRYNTRYIPGQQLYLTQATPEHWATVVIDNSDLQRPRVIESRIRRA